MSDARLIPDQSVMRFRKHARITGAVVDLWRNPVGPRVRQLVFGDTVAHLGDADNMAYVQSAKDGYCGYVDPKFLGDASAPTHWVTAASSTTYTEPHFKAPDLKTLTFGSQLCVTEEIDGFAKTDIGYVPLIHLGPMSERFDDPADVAALFLGTPYLWGGNSRWGIDCSGLVQAALLACGLPCPGDSDQQMALGSPTNGKHQRNDLLFWKGHVAIVTDETTLIHANAGSMSTRYEGIDAAISRILEQGDGPVTAHRRLPRFVV